MVDNEEREDVDFEESEVSAPFNRLIHTQGYDLSLNTLEEQWSDHTLVIPEFQRDYVWDDGKASRLIESLVLSIPIPPLYFAETEQAEFEVVDGHQRVRSTIRFLRNEFRLSGLQILTEYKGRYFFELPEREQRFLRTRTLRAIVISADSSSEMKFEVFSRLNTGGISLNGQEIRNAIYQGLFNDLLDELAQNLEFRNALGVRRPRRRKVDEELVLRFFALHDWLNVYRPPLSRFLNGYMKTFQNPGGSWLIEKSNSFEVTMAAVWNLLGDRAFRLVNVSTGQFERSVNRALFDAQSIAFASADRSAVIDRADVLRPKIFNLLLDSNFHDATTRATGDRARTLLRINMVAEAIESSGVEVDHDLLPAE
jgi:hypothetical protein